jgi:hypothetical protein
MDVDQIVRVYTKIRDERTRQKQLFEEADRALKGKQEKLESVLLQYLQSTGLQSARTGHGTVYVEEEMKPSASDWSAVYAFIADEGAFEMLEKRLTKTFIRSYMDDHDGELPPGVRVHREFAVRVRRS